MHNRLILGSASERRRRILRDLGAHFDVVVPEVSEITSGHPDEVALKNARSKNNWCARRFPESHILTADTVVCLDGRTYGKPANLTEAEHFLRTLSGRTHSVLTAVVLTPPLCSKRPARTRLVESFVKFKKLDDATIKLYLSTVKPFDRAAAYDIHESGDLIIESYTGSYTNIMGLPAEVVREWLEDEGIIS